MQDLFERLTENVLKTPAQGYALSFRWNGQRLDRVNGLTAEEGSDPIGFDTRFRLASVTKQFIAFGIVRLVKAGRLSFETPVRELYPEFPPYFDGITVRNLLNHTAGLANYEEIEHAEDAPQIRDAEIVPFLASTKEALFAPGTQYKYNNTAYVLLGQIIELVSGQPLTEYMREEVFLPAGMRDTLVNVQGVTRFDRRAYGHRFIDGELRPMDQYWCSATIGDGGIYSTVNDLEKWIDYLTAHRKQYEDSMFRANVLPDGTDSEYGMGMRVISREGIRIWYHTGSTIGTNTMLLFSPDADLRCVFLTNCNINDTLVMKDNILRMLADTETRR